MEKFLDQIDSFLKENAKKNIFLLDYPTKTILFWKEEEVVILKISPEISLDRRLMHTVFENFGWRISFPENFNSILFSRIENANLTFIFVKVFGDAYYIDNPRKMFLV